jgi:GNAT superfamily N-acetyltransferase
MMLETIHRKAVAKSLHNLDIVLAGSSDADELNELFQRFFAEAGYANRGIVYDPKKAQDWLCEVLAFGTCPHIIARIEGRIVGVLSYELDDTFSEKPIAVLHVFYVVPEHRKSALGRMLLQFAMDVATTVDDACAFHAPVASEVNDVASLCNLFHKAGFSAIGFIAGRAL